MSRINLAYIEDLYTSWRKDPTSVPGSWQEYFAHWEKNGADPEALSVVAPSLYVESDASPSTPAHARSNISTSREGEDKQRRVDAMIAAYRDIGVLYAHVNPLAQYETKEMQRLKMIVRGVSVGLEPEAFGLGKEDNDVLFYAGDFFAGEKVPLRTILKEYRTMYCGSVGYDFSHIRNTAMRNWLLTRIESPKHKKDMVPDLKIRIQKDLIKAEGFEAFVQRNFVGQKRFSLEGSEVVIPAVHYLIRNTLDYKVNDIVLGMSHRGRLNLFTNSIRKPAHETFAIFVGSSFHHEVGGTGDVKYHLGHSFDYVDRKTNRSVHISLVANPSHLEAVNPVVEGKARGIQRKRKDINRKKTIPLLIHGDAAFIGQGVVTETLNLSHLRGYKTGGTIHIIVNNQIGFTTSPRDGRSTYFATDFAKALQIPIFHVNGDDPEATISAIDCALAWRQKFGTDAIIDIVSYRRRGHNESDEPSFTHPHMYKLIREHPSVTTLYGKKLADAGIYSEQEQKTFKKKYQDVLKAELDIASNVSVHDIVATPYRGEWEKYHNDYSFKPIATGVEKKNLTNVAHVLTTPPSNFHPHPKLTRLLNENKASFEKDTGLNWGFAEALAYGTLVREGYHVRLSGEDSGRGTFSHRHAQWWDHRTENSKQYTPLQHISEGQAPFSVHNSPLSEFSVLGFEYGYSLTQPDALIIWEAQFGDFANGAQVIIDQFVSSGESKWRRACGLVLLLPHGYEGQGPEHSSAHLERFLSLCANQNMQIANCTTPAQFFHLLRRQVYQTIRLPLIVMSPKALLRHPQAKSSVQELCTGHFQNVVYELEEIQDAETLILCSGKVYYDLYNYRKKNSYAIPLIRLEQLYPFPEEELSSVFDRCKKLKKVTWVQEEAKNHGAWLYIAEEFRARFSIPLEYVGRAPSSSPAQGSHQKHVLELEGILKESFSS